MEEKSSLPQLSRMNAVHAVHLSHRPTTYTLLGGFNWLKQTPPRR